MKRPVCLLLLSALVTAFLFGCSADTPNSTVSSAPQETADPRILEIMDSLSGIKAETPEDQLLAETDMLTLSRKNGHCYLNFKSGNHKIFLDIGEKDSCGHAVFFDSVEQLHQWLLAPTISKDTEEAIRHCTPLDEANGFLFPDPERIFTLSLPFTYRLERAYLHGEEYALTYVQSPSDRFNGVFIQTISKDRFTSHLEQYYRFQHGRAAYSTSYAADKNNAIAYEYETEVLKLRDVQYRLQTEDMTLFVEEHYLLSRHDPADSDYHFANVTIFGCIDGLFFTLNRYHSDPQTLIGLLDDLKIVKYVP